MRVRQVFAQPKDVRSLSCQCSPKIHGRNAELSLLAIPNWLGVVLTAQKKLLTQRFALMVLLGTDPSGRQAKTERRIFWLMRDGHWREGDHAHPFSSTQCVICGRALQLLSSFALDEVTCTNCRLRQKKVVEEWGD